MSPMSRGLSRKQLPWQASLWVSLHTFTAGHTITNTLKNAPTLWIILQTRDVQTDSCTDRLSRLGGCYVFLLPWQSYSKCKIGCSGVNWAILSFLEFFPTLSCSSASLTSLPCDLLQTPYFLSSLISYTIDSIYVRRYILSMVTFDTLGRDARCLSTLLYLAMRRTRLDRYQQQYGGIPSPLY